MTDTLQSGAESALDLDKLEALLLAATPDDWKAQRQGVIVGGPYRHYANGSAQSQIAAFSVTFHPDAPDDEPERQQANADFCAAAKNAMPALLALARRATAPHAATDERAKFDAWFDAVPEQERMRTLLAGNRMVSLTAWQASRAELATHPAGPAVGGALVAKGTNWNAVMDLIADELEAKSNMNEISQFTSLCEEFDRMRKLLAVEGACAECGGSRLVESAHSSTSYSTAPCRACAAPTGALVAVKDEQQDQVSVMPPFAAPASQHDAGTSAWISTDDRMPQDGEHVLTYYWPYNNHENDRIIGVAEHIEGTFYNHEGDECHPPSHWMPRPPLPDQSNTAGSAKGGTTQPESSGSLATQPTGNAEQGEQPLTRCAASRDGECSNLQCPQLRDGEPKKSGRHCPLDNDSEDD